MSLRCGLIVIICGYFFGSAWGIANEPDRKAIKKVLIYWVS